MGPNILNATQFIASGYPYITGSTLDLNEEINVVFPNVTKSFTVINKSSIGLRVHFLSQDTTNVISGLHYITLENLNDSVTMNVKCREIFVSNVIANSGSFELFAELTKVDVDSMWQLSGAGISE